ncbi:MAG TPA: GAF domain-containing protein, partial [Anaerolineales bacterium]
MTDHVESIESLQRKLAEGEEQHRRSEKIQSALYQIAEAASVVSDMQTFYARLHEIVGGLMYARNFFIALYEARSGMMSWPYHVDEKDVDVELWLPRPLRQDNGITSYVLRTGNLVHPREDNSVVESGEVQVIGTIPEDAIIVPLKADGETLGVLSVQSQEPGVVYSGQDVQVLAFVAQHIATAITRARAIEETRQRNSELAILNSVGEAMAKTLDVKTVTRIVGDKVRDIFNAEGVMVGLFDPAANLVNTEYEYDKQEGGYVDYRPPLRLGTGLTSKLIQLRQPLVLGTLEEQVANGGYFAPEVLEKGSGMMAQSWMGVPILAADQVLGTVVITDYRPHAFGESHLRLLQTLSANMGVAIQNARLFEAEQQRIAELQIINSIQQGLASKLELQAIIDLVGDKLREVLHSDEVGIRLYDENTDLVHYVYQVEHGERLSVTTLRPSALFREIQKNRLPVFGKTLEIYERYGAFTIPGTDTSKSFATVPIISGDKVIGSILVEDYEREDAFNEANIRLMQTIASSMGVALENARLFDETQRLFKAEQQRAAELTIINSIQEGLAKQLDFHAIIDLVGEKIREIFDSQVTFIALYDAQTGRMSFPYLYGPLDGRMQRTYPPSAPLGGFSGEVVRTRQPVIINQDMARRSAETDGGLLAGTEYPKSGIYIPLQSAERVIGVVSLQNMDRENAFSESDVRLLQTLANSMSVALENARLFDETQRLFKAEQERAAELSLINSVQEGLASKLELQAIIDLVGDKIRELFHSTTMSIRLYDRTTNILSYPYVIDAGKRDRIDPIPLGKGLTAHILETRQTLVINENLEQHMAELGSYWLVTAEKENDKSFVGVPILAGDQAIGAVVLGSKKEKAFGDADVRLLQTLTSSMGVALENARLFDETQRLFKAEQQRAAELAIINSVQEGLASKLEMQAIYDLVGDKIRDIFDAQSIMVGVIDPERRTRRIVYGWEKGLRQEARDVAFNKLTERLIESTEPIVINEDAASAFVKYGMTVTPGTEFARSMIFVPIVTAGEVTGFVSLQNVDRENAFSESDVRLLQTLANSMSVALENARLFDETQRLFKAEQQRAAELAIINSVQEGLASKLEMQAIYDLVGDKIREIFDAQSVLVGMFDRGQRVRRIVYNWEKGVRLVPANVPFNRLTEHLIESREPIVINEDAAAAFVKYGMIVNPGTEFAKSMIFVPIVAAGEVTGFVSLQNVDRENAFSESDVRLLQTLASSMSVALENARLFDETQRLLQETEQRAAELAIINSVQEGLASKLEMQAIHDLVGDKIREIFHADTT